MSLIGYFQVREVDAIKYNIYKSNNKTYINYKNKNYIINLPEKYNNISNLYITLSKKINYDDYYIEKLNNFEFIYINDEKVKNKYNNYSIISLLV